MSDSDVEELKAQNRTLHGIILKMRQELKELAARLAQERAQRRDARPGIDVD